MAKHDDDIVRLRKTTEEIMRCLSCGGDVLIGRRFLVCENGCRVEQHWDMSLKSLRDAWPERVIEHRRRSLTKKQIAKNRQGDPKLFDT